MIPAILEALDQIADYPLISAPGDDGREMPPAPLAVRTMRPKGQRIRTDRAALLWHGNDQGLAFRADHPFIRTISLQPNAADPAMPRIEQAAESAQCTASNGPEINHRKSREVAVEAGASGATAQRLPPPREEREEKRSRPAPRRGTEPDQTKGDSPRGFCH